MPDVTFWEKRFKDLGEHSVGPGDTTSEEELDLHRQVFLVNIKPLLKNLKGPVLDFGCGVGRWVVDLPRPYLGLDLTPEHIESCRAKFAHQHHVDFQLSNNLETLPDKSITSVFTVTVLQHIVEPELRKEVLRQFQRVLNDDGVFLSVEWAEGQREYDWCTSVRKAELRRWFTVKNMGEVVESGRRHTIWVCRKKTRIFSLFQ